MNGCCEDKKYGKGCTPETCMSLPEGKTCGDCVHWIRCETLGFSDSRDLTDCSFFPRRFREKTRTEGNADNARHEVRTTP